MDLTSVLMKSLLSDDSVKSLSKKTGSSKSEVSDVLTAALPLLIKGASQQAEDESTAESFLNALSKHGENDTSDMDSFMDNVDMADGAKILSHLLGAETESTTKQLSRTSGTSSDSTAQILAAAAPLLMSVLGQENKKSTRSSSKKASGDLVGALLSAALENVNVTELLMDALTDSLASESEENKTTRKKSASTKKTTTKKSTTAKKTTAKKATTAKKTTAKKKAASTKKKSASDSIDVGDVANLLTKLLK